MLLCHGYTEVKDLHLPDNAKVLNEAGYVAMTFDYKGRGQTTRAGAGARVSRRCGWLPTAGGRLKLGAARLAALPVGTAHCPGW